MQEWNIKMAEQNEEIKMEQERNGETHMEHENHQYGSMT